MYFLPLLDQGSTTAHAPHQAESDAEWLHLITTVQAMHSNLSTAQAAFYGCDDRYRDSEQDLDWSVEQLLKQAMRVVSDHHLNESASGSSSETDPYQQHGNSSPEQQQALLRKMMSWWSRFFDWCFPTWSDRAKAFQSFSYNVRRLQSDSMRLMTRSQRLNSEYLDHCLTNTAASVMLLKKQIRIIRTATQALLKLRREESAGWFGQIFSPFSAAAALVFAGSSEKPDLGKPTLETLATVGEMVSGLVKQARDDLESEKRRRARNHSVVSWIAERLALDDSKMDAVVVAQEHEYAGSQTGQMQSIIGLIVEHWEEADRAGWK
ncbi:hypothetical protein LIA77_11996 [Sarocladium implicatum]|nr:hypothetical protein LIA77_11996 [Sarocladium implicatum]